MIYLLLAVISSTLITLFMRLGEGKIQNNMGMFAVNYLICLVMSRLSMGQMNLFTSEDGILISVGMGLIAGCMFLGSFVFMQWNMRKNGVVLTSTFTKLGVVVPTLMAILVFREQPRLLQAIGMLLALAAIIIIHFDKDGNDTAQAAAGNFKIWLILQLLVSGFTDSLAGIYEKAGNVALKDHYLFYTFLTAMVLSVILMMRKKVKVCKWDLLFGFIIGIPNYFSASFLLLALQSVPAIVVYPGYSVGTILAISAASVVLFKERISNRKKVAIAIVLLALVLLNM